MLIVKHVKKLQLNAHHALKETSFSKMIINVIQVAPLLVLELLKMKFLFAKNVLIIVPYVIQMILENVQIVSISIC